MLGSQGKGRRIETDETLPIAKAPLARLRQIREQQRRLDALNGERNLLILRALGEGHSLRKVGQAVGLTHGRVKQIAKKVDSD